MANLSRYFRQGVSVFAATLVIVAALGARPASGAPYDYTDNWYVPAEEGWGVNFTQTDNFIFATTFIYGLDKQPTWYTAQMTWDGQTQFAGGIYRTTGTYFGSPWNPADKMGGAVLVGTASFTPSTLNNYEGTFSYTVSGVTVTKAVTRLTLSPVSLAANYVGGQSGRYSGCASVASNREYQDFFTMAVSQSGFDVTLTFTYPNHTPVALTCTLAGTMIQNGAIYRIPNASYQCSDGVSTNASVSDLRATPLGIEGQFDAPLVAFGCRETARFGGTLN